MKYRLVKDCNPTHKSYNKYVAKAVHHNTVTSQELALEIQEACSAHVADVVLVLCQLQDVLISHLRNGDKVELPYLGTMKLEVNSRAVDTEEEFNAHEHIKGVSLHMLPKCRDGVPEVYRDIKYEKEKR